MADRFVIEDGRFGPRLVLQSAWSEDVRGFMRAHGLKELHLNYAKGFVGDDISFVATMPELEAFWIIHRTIEDISPFHALENLRSLKVDTYCKTALDFSRFPKLEHCHLEWRRGVRGLFALPHLEELSLNGYDGDRTDVFGRLEALRTLSLSNSRVSGLDELASLCRLEFLGLYRLRKLGSLRGVESLQTLQTLEIQECRKLESLDEICSLTNLRRLLLIDLGSVASLRCLARLTELEEVLFYGSTNVRDGDLGWLQHLPKLKNLSFQNRRHYSHKREEFEQY